MNVQTVPDTMIDDIVKEAVLTLRNSHFNEFVGFSVMRNMTPWEIKRRSKHQEEQLSLLKGR